VSNFERQKYFVGGAWWMFMGTITQIEFGGTMLR
jgi:hypothetical protein